MPAEGAPISPTALYRVTIRIDQDIAGEWLGWMRSTHIPDVLATGCFTGCTIARQAEPADPDQREAFVLDYGLAVPERFAEYESACASALRQEHTARYLGRFEASRQVLVVLGAMSPSGARG